MVGYWLKFGEIMMRKKNIIADFHDRAVDLISKVQSPVSRSGACIERVSKMLENGVDPEVIALQMTKNSPNDKEYTVEDIMAYDKLSKDSETKVVITAKQTRALIREQKAQRQNDTNSFGESEQLVWRSDSIIKKA